MILSAKFSPGLEVSSSEVYLYQRTLHSVPNSSSLCPTIFLRAFSSSSRSCLAYNYESGIAEVAILPIFAAGSLCLIRISGVFLQRSTERSG